MKSLILISYVVTWLLLGCNNQSKPETSSTSVDLANSPNPSATTIDNISNNDTLLPVDQATREKAYQDYMTPGPMHKLLASLNGEWQGDVTFWPAIGARPIKSTSSVVNKMLYGGLFQEGIHKSTINGKPYETKLIWGYDNVKKEFFILAIDNMGSGFGHLEGTYDTASKVFNFVLHKTDPVTGEDNLFREVRKIVNTDRQEMKMYQTDKKTGKEYQSLEIIYTRKK